MIFANPPYFLSKGCSLQINGIWKNFEKGEWDGERDFEAIKAFNYKWLSAYRKVLKMTELYGYVVPIIIYSP